MIYQFFWKNHWIFMHFLENDILFKYENVGKVDLWQVVYQSLDSWDFLECTGILKVLHGKSFDKFLFLDYRDFMYRKASRHPVWIHYVSCFMRSCIFWLDLKQNCLRSFDRMKSSRLSCLGRSCLNQNVQIPKVTQWENFIG